MKPYTTVDVSEQELEDLVRRHTELIEDGLVYVDHQKPTGAGRLDVLMVDSGKALVVAELKVMQDDAMLLQGLDYYDFTAMHVEPFARLYREHSIDPTQQVRLFLIAPSFSQALVTRCKWLNLPVSLFTFNCLRFDGKDEVVPIFAEQSVPAIIEPPEVPHLEDHLAYITEPTVRTQVESLLKEIQNWKSGSISVDPIKSAISLKVNGRVFAYLLPRRRHYLFGTFDAEGDWTEYSVKSDDDLAKVKPIVRAAMEKRAR